MSELGTNSGPLHIQYGVNKGSLRTYSCGNNTTIITQNYLPEARNASFITGSMITGLTEK